MGNQVQHEIAKARAQLRLIRRLTDATGYNRSELGGVQRERKWTETGAEANLGYRVEERRLLSPPDTAISRNLREQTKMALAALTPREQLVLRMCFGIGETDGDTLEEIGQRFVLTAEEVSFIAAKALRKLRQPNRSGLLKNVDGG